VEKSLNNKIMRVLFLLLLVQITFAQTTTTVKPKPNMMKASMLVMKINPTCKVNYKIPKTFVRFVAVPDVACMDSIIFFKELRKLEQSVYE
jgi:hypothetical protein